MNIKLASFLLLLQVFLESCHTRSIDGSFNPNYFEINDRKLPGRRAPRSVIIHGGGPPVQEKSVLETSTTTQDAEVVSTPPASTTDTQSLAIALATTETNPEAETTASDESSSTNVIKPIETTARSDTTTEKVEIDTPIDSSSTEIPISTTDTSSSTTEMSATGETSDDLPKTTKELADASSTESDGSPAKTHNSKASASPEKDHSTVTSQTEDSILMNSNSFNMKMELLIIVGVILGALILLLIGTIVFYFCYCKSTPQNNSQPTKSSSRNFNARRKNSNTGYYRHHDGYDVNKEKEYCTTKKKVNKRRESFNPTVIPIPGGLPMIASDLDSSKAQCDEPGPSSLARDI